MAARIEIEGDRCIGAAQCVLSADKLFDQDEDGFVVVLNGEPDGEDLEDARTAAMICPSQSITVVED
ncbi:ferredoxin [Actinoplanes sp. LDG1-06]|uniref:Ferredoxin n=1 Tax=Paractinoplanes ovalisporus TaxID=2810368 RepID=A0ABS2AIM5_9ACTN|nr:ferredoxin [Actinoplanes ovalisporus]MBM2619676.1 ferredoxin [Actinoplanes ovalisporus]